MGLSLAPDRLKTMFRSFRYKLLLAFVLLIGAALTATISLVWPYTRQSIIDNAQHELEISLNRFHTLLADNAKLRRTQVALLLNDPAFKQAMASADQDELIAIMKNYGKSIDADMIVLSNATGEIIVNTHPNALGTPDLQALNPQQPQVVEMYTVASEKPYQVFFMPVLIPNLIAWIGIGAAIDQSWLDTFKTVTATDITLQYQYNGQTYTLSSNDNTPAANKTVQISADLNNGVSKSPIKVLLSNSVREQLEPFDPLLQRVIYIGLATLVLATIAALFIARGISRPIKVLTKAARSIAKGDYSGKIAVIEKNEFGELGQALNNMRQAINDREQHIGYQAKHDLLTGVANRYYLGDWIKDRLKEELPCEPFSLAIVHIYNFNQLVDLYGSDICDQLIVKIAQSIEATLREPDHVARLDGNQFLVYLANTEPDDTENQCTHILNIAGQHFPIGPIELHSDVRIGAACYPEHGQRYDELVRRASIALSNAHSHKSDFYLYKNGEDDVHLRKVRITNRLQNALRIGNFSLLYQPQLDVRNNTIVRAEALIRWQDQELGEVSPEEFIPLAERSGDITGITRWILDAAIRQILKWRKQGLGLGVSINLSARDIKNTDFISYLLDQIEKHRLGTSDITLEVTESAVMEYAKTSIANLQRLRTFGLHVAMDDFGTGYSSLSQLKTLPISELKIDKAFIDDITNNDDDQKIATAIIDMAHHLGLDVITEGVKDQAAMNLIKTLGCDIVQGYHLSKPLSASALEQWLRERDSESGNDQPSHTKNSLECV